MFDTVYVIKNRAVLCNPGTLDKKFDKYQAGKKSSNMGRICNTASISSAKHSKAAYYLKNDPDTDGPKSRYMCDEPHKKHCNSPSWK